MPLQPQHTSQSPGSHHSQPPQLSLEGAAWLLQGFLRPFYTKAFCTQTWVPFGPVLLSCLFYMQNKCLLYILLVLYVITYTNSPSTFLLQRLPCGSWMPREACGARDKNVLG